MLLVILKHIVLIKEKGRLVLNNIINDKIIIKKLYNIIIIIQYYK